VRVAAFLRDAVNRDSDSTSISTVGTLRPQCAEHEVRRSTESPPLPRGPSTRIEDSRLPTRTRSVLVTATDAGPRRPPPPHRRGCRREARAAPSASQREVLVSEANEGTRELALSEDERPTGASRLGGPEGCTGRCSHKWSTNELLLLSRSSNASAMTYQKSAGNTPTPRNLLSRTTTPRPTDGSLRARCRRGPSRPPRADARRWPPG